MALYKCLGGGGKSASGIYPTSTTGVKTIDLGWEPKYLAVWVQESGQIFIYNSDMSTTSFRRAGTGAYSQNATMPYTSSGALRQITSNGFEVNGYSGQTRTFYYFAIG